MWLTNWDRLLNFAQRKFPKPGRYGPSLEGDAVQLVKLLRNESEMARIADELFKIDCAYEAAAAPLLEKLKKASKDRSDAEARLLDTIKC
ncbi:hypothetical protein X566_19950 [Afipia sp. P52-10]|nr:hypothetical protein X566_19950 [Afipia sp. P52-10]